MFDFESYDPETLERAAQSVDGLRADLLFGADAGGSEDCVSVAHYRSALALLEQASQQLQLAGFAQARALWELRTGKARP